MRKQLHYDWHWFWDYGNGDLGNQGVHEMDKARWGLNKNELPKSVVSVGGRLGYVDDGETANTQLCVFDYGDCELIFEVRGLPSTARTRAPGREEGVELRRQHLLRREGDPRLPELQQRRRARARTCRWCKSSRAADDNSTSRTSSRRSAAGKHEDLNCDITEGHLSAALCHLANISYRLGKEVARSAN